jgi:hypothetical protein
VDRATWLDPLHAIRANGLRAVLLSSCQQTAGAGEGARIPLKILAPVTKEGLLLARFRIDQHPYWGLCINVRGTSRGPQNAEQGSAIPLPRLSLHYSMSHCRSMTFHPQ